MQTKASSGLFPPLPWSEMPLRIPTTCCSCRLLFSHISQSILGPFCCWLPKRQLPLSSNMPPGASAEMWVVDWLARRLGRKKLNQTQNQIFRSLSPQFPPTVISRLKIQPPSLISSSLWRLWVSWGLAAFGKCSKCWWDAAQPVMPEQQGYPRAPASATQVVKNWNRANGKFSNKCFEIMEHTLQL